MKKFILLSLLLLVACGETAVPTATLPKPDPRPSAQPTLTTAATLTEIEAMRWPVYQFAKYGVTVHVYLDRDAEGQLQLTADYVPEEADMHVYGLSLPKEGIDGVGRPTLLEVMAGDLVVNGDLTANVEASDHEFPTFAEPFPLYPDGSVTLSLPVALAEDADLSQVELSITYMACSSEGVCKPPVTDHRFTIEVPEISN